MTLIKLSDNEFILKYDHKRARYCSNLETLFVLGKVREMDLDELEHAVLELERKNHNCAELGDIRGAFITSKRI